MTQFIRQTFSNTFIICDLDSKSEVCPWYTHLLQFSVQWNTNTAPPARMKIQKKDLQVWLGENYSDEVLQLETFFQKVVKDNLNPHLHTLASFLAWFLAATQNNSRDGHFGSQTCVQGTATEIKEREDIYKKNPAVVLGRLTTRSKGTAELKPKF